VSAQGEGRSLARLQDDRYFIRIVVLKESPLRTSRTVAFLLSIATVAGLTACSADAGAETDGPPATSDALPTVDIAAFDGTSARLDFDHAIPTLPLDDLSLSSPVFVSKVLHALAVAADSCMTEQGHEAVADRIDWSPYLLEEDRTYGLWSVPYASRFGFDLATDTGPRTLDTLPLGVDFNKAYPVCMEEAKSSMTDELTFAQGPDIDWRIRTEAQSRASASDAGEAAHADWEACMEEAGLVLDPDDGRPSEQYSAQGEESEIGAAVTEARCAQTTGAVQTLYDLQAKYEAAYRDDQAAQIQAFSEKRRKVERFFDDVIAGR